MCGAAWVARKLTRNQKKAVPLHTSLADSHEAFLSFRFPNFVLLGDMLLRGALCRRAGHCTMALSYQTPGGWGSLRGLDQ